MLDTMGDMNHTIYIPDNLRSAGREVCHAIKTPLELLPRTDFLRVWSSVAYLFPSMHPDGIFESDNGWPRGLNRFVAEAWRRNEAGEFTTDELYPSDAQWAGLYDRTFTHTPDETERRLQLATEAGEGFHA